MKYLLLINWCVLSIAMIVLGSETMAVIMTGINGTILLFYLVHVTTTEDLDVRRKQVDKQSKNIYKPRK